MSCTTKRDGRAYRLYHNTTAKYNGFYYANEALDEADGKLEEMHEERWDEVLPLFLESDESTAQQIFPLMERAIEKCTRVVDRHTMAPPKRMTKSFNRPVMNKWIDDNYTVIGKSYYLKGDYPKAEEIFTYLSRTVDGDDAEAWSFSWLGRTHMRTGDEIKAKNALAKAESIRDASDEAMVHTLMVLAQYKILNGDYEAAARHLEDALPRMGKKDKARTRATFVLAQCLREAKDKEGAIEQFQEVASMRWADYEWVFQGNIQQAMTYERRNGNSEAIVELLEAMLEDHKNEPYWTKCSLRWESGVGRPKEGRVVWTVQAERCGTYRRRSPTRQRLPEARRPLHGGFGVPNRTSLLRQRFGLRRRRRRTDGGGECIGLRLEQFGRKSQHHSRGGQHADALRHGRRPSFEGRGPGASQHGIGVEENARGP
jgi:tetratricopeptide (TPR) repeat protein